VRTADTIALLLRAGGRPISSRTWAHLVVTGPLPLVAIVAGPTVLTTCVSAPDLTAERYGSLASALASAGGGPLVVGVGLVALLLTVLVADLAIRARATVAQNVLQLAAVSAVVLAVPLLDRVAAASVVAGAGFVAWSMWPRLAVYLGLAEVDSSESDSGTSGDSDLSPGREVMSMFDHLEPGRSWAPYVCRGCGTEIAYKDRFLKCPVCGIKFN